MSCFKYDPMSISRRLHRRAAGRVRYILGNHGHFGDSRHNAELPFVMSPFQVEILKEHPLIFQCLVFIVESGKCLYDTLNKNRTSIAAPTVIPNPSNITKMYRVRYILGNHGQSSRSPATVEIPSRAAASVAET